MKLWGLVTGGVSLVIEQGALSGGNFLAAVIVARHVSPVHYGIFAALQSSLWIAQSVYSAVVLEPMTMLAATEYHDQRTRYFRMMLVGHGPFSFGVALLCLPLLWIMIRGADLQGAATIWAFLVSTPAMLLLWWARRACQIEYLPRRTAISGVLYGGTTIFLLECLIALRLLDHVTAFLALGISSFAAALPMAAAAVRGRGEDTRALRWKQILTKHWYFGRWDLTAGIFHNISVQMPTFVLAGAGRLDGAGTLRAMAVLVTPVLLLLPPAAALIVPKVARDLSAGNGQRARQTVRRFSLAATSVAGICAIFVTVFSTQIERVAFGEKYADAAWMIGPLSLVGVIAASTLGRLVSMRAALWPQCSAIIAAVSLVASLIASPAILLFGLPGAVAAALASTAAGSVATVLVHHYFHRGRRNVAGAYTKSSE